MFYYLSKIIIKLLGFQIVGKTPVEKKYILIGEHHTSNWDFVFMLLAKSYYKIQLNWVGKHTMFKFPFETLLKYLGGIPVYRHLKTNLVGQIVNQFNSREEFQLALAPSGTRKYTDHWKSGFYHMATSANVPIIFAFIDTKDKVFGFSEPFHLSGDVNKDMDLIREFYSKITPRFPEKASRIYIKEEG